MDGAFLSAVIGLAGVAVGGLTSVATTWLSHTSDTAEKRRQAELDKREKLFNDFVDEASRLYGDALGHCTADLTKLVPLYALLSRMRMFCSDAVIAEAEATMHQIIETYMAPNRTLAEMRELAEAGGLDLLVAFDQAGRRELAHIAAAPLHRLHGGSSLA